MASRKTNTYGTVTALKTLLNAIYAKPMTQTEIIEATGLCNSTVSRWLRFLHRRPNIVYINGYRRTGERGNWAKVWSAGFMVQDADPPRAMSSAEYNKRWRKNKARKSLINQTQQSNGVIIHELSTF